MSCLDHLQKLTGQKAPFQHDEHDFDKIFKEHGGLTYNQLNELLLIHGYDRIALPEFFDFLIKLSEKPHSNDRILTIDQFEEIVNEFVNVALIAYGNVKFAFKTLSKVEEQLRYCIDLIKEKDIAFYKKRSKILLPISPIDKYKTYYLGVYLQEEIVKQYERNPEDPFWKNEKKEMDRITEIGKKNNDSYLVSDHMDVYIATSMRKKHDYVVVNEFIDEIFASPEIEELNLRRFDPTQAFCSNRVDKGLTEALMLKRADCTIYLVQESDTLGKDSELATTLAQGKPVIAYVPKGDEIYVRKLINAITYYNKGKDPKEVLLELLCIFDPSLIWNKDETLIRNAINDHSIVEEGQLFDKLCEVAKRQYNKRAETLQEKHPLGIQINLNTGVANGVLVVREIPDCIKLLKSIILNTFTFKIDKVGQEGNPELLVLKEHNTGSIYRVMTYNQLLTSTFWNFYTNNDKE